MPESPQTMQANPHYDNVTQTVLNFMQKQVETCLTHGIAPNNLILDPGWGFGKTAAHNFQLLRELEVLKSLGFPILAGLSRKAMIGVVLGLPPEQRLAPSLALATFAVTQGISILRTHDVLPTVQAIRMIEAVLA